MKLIGKRHGKTGKTDNFDVKTGKTGSKTGYVPTIVTSKGQQLPAVQQVVFPPRRCISKNGLVSTAPATTACMRY